MCTAICFKTKDFYFGRTLDYDFSYLEEVTVTPRNFEFKLRHTDPLYTHYAMIGMAYIFDGYPLYYDAANERGLAMAALSFPKSAHYNKIINGRENIAQFEFIPRVLGECASVSEARRLLEDINLIDEAFSDGLPVSPLHWIIADRDGAITVEATREGLRVYDNRVGVLTNEPPFDEQTSRLCDYMALSSREPVNYFAADLSLEPYSRGMGAMGLPGDLSSASRFVRAAFTLHNSRTGDSEEESVGQFFHILGTVEQVRGCCEVAPEKFEITIYSSCCNATRGIYYYTTYGNRRISAVDMRSEALDTSELVRYPLILGEQIYRQN